MLKFDDGWTFDTRASHFVWGHRCGRIKVKFWCVECCTAVPKALSQKVFLLGYKYHTASTDRLISMFKEHGIKHDYEV